MTATALEEFLIEAAAHALRATFADSDPHWIRACARLQVLGDRARLAENEQASCWAMLATFEREHIGRSIGFNGTATVNVPPGGQRA